MIKTDIPTWRDLPDDAYDQKTMYRNDRVLFTASRDMMNDHAPWADDVGQVPFLSPGDLRTIDLAANEHYLPLDVDDVSRLAWEWPGGLEDVARYLRIFHDNVRIAEVHTMRTGYSQGDQRDVLAVVTDEWLGVTGARLDGVREEIDNRSHLAEVAAWCAGDFITIDFYELDPLATACDCERPDPYLCDGWDMVEHESWNDPMDGPEHDTVDVDKWLMTAVWHVDSLVDQARERHEDAMNSGHYVI